MTMTMTMTEVTEETEETEATTKYKELITTIDAKILKIQNYLNKHSKLQKNDPKNWCYTGDLNFVEEHIDGILKFLENDS